MRDEKEGLGKLKQLLLHCTRVKGKPHFSGSHSDAINDVTEGDDRLSHVIQMSYEKEQKDDARNVTVDACEGNAGVSEYPLCGHCGSAGPVHHNGVHMKIVDTYS